MSTDNEFNEIQIRICIEEFTANICKRVKGVQWISIITNTFVEELAKHSKYYRISKQVVTHKTVDVGKLNKKLSSPQTRNRKGLAPKRTKSETDLIWQNGE